MRKNPGRCIVFEGPDGSGKSTLCRAVLDHYSFQAKMKTKPTLWSIRYPTHTTAPGKLIHHIFSGVVTVDPKTMLYLLLADFVEMSVRLKPQLTDDALVIVDRHPLVSGWAYQTETYTLEDVLACQRRHDIDGFDLVFILDVPAAVSEERLSARKTRRNAMYEVQDPLYQERLRDRYRAYAAMHPQHTVLLDGTQPIETLVKQVTDRIDALEVSI